MESLSSCPEQDHKGVRGRNGKKKPERIYKNDGHTYGPYLFSQNEEKKNLLEHIAC